MLNKILMIFQNYKGRTTERPHALEGEFLARYRFASRFIKDKEVIDVGTGLGAGAYHLALNGAKRVLGIDYSKSAIDYARRSFSLPNLKFRIMNVTNLSLLPNSFDVVFAFEIIEHLQPKYYDNFLQGIIRIIKVDGITLLSTCNKLISSPSCTKPYNPDHIREFEPREFVNLLKKYFSEVSLKGVKCINKDYIGQQKRLQQSLKYKMASFLGRYKIVRELLAYVPKGLKQRATSEYRLPDLKASDFEITADDIENCEGLLAICKK